MFDYRFDFSSTAEFVVGGLLMVALIAIALVIA